MRYMHMPCHDSIVHNGKTVDIVRVVVNSGHLSLDNGANAPLSYFFDLAKLAGIPPELGDTYGQDCLLVPRQDWPEFEKLLVENKMLYRMAGFNQPWQNILSESVQARLS